MWHRLSILRLGVIFAACLTAAALTHPAIAATLCIACCVPIFFAGIIFTSSFQRSAGSSSAFGANMLGAVAGGLAQNLFFLLGMKALLLIAALFYLGSALVNFTRPLPQPSQP